MPAAKEDCIAPNQAEDEFECDKLTQKVEGEKWKEELNSLLLYLRSPAFFRDHIQKLYGDTLMDNFEVLDGAPEISCADILLSVRQVGNVKLRCRRNVWGSKHSQRFLALWNLIYESGTQMDQVVALVPLSLHRSRDNE